MELWLFISLVVYMAGVYVAYFQLTEWANPEALDKKVGVLLPVLSLMSWLIYPIYGIIKLTEK